MFKSEHCFKKCEYTDSQRVIHTAVGPELQKKKKENHYRNTHNCSSTQYAPDYTNHQNTRNIKVSGVTRHHGDFCKYKFRNVCTVSNFCNAHKTCGRSVLRIKLSIFHFLFKIFYIPIHISHLTSKDSCRWSLKLFNLMKTGTVIQFFTNFSNINYCKNISSDSWVVLCVKRDGEPQGT
jgi:hypothetical protein